MSFRCIAMSTEVAVRDLRLVGLRSYDATDHMLYDLTVRVCDPEYSLDSLNTADGTPADWQRNAANDMANRNRAVCLECEGGWDA